jgi:hypothetical protein
MAYCVVSVAEMKITTLVAGCMRKLNNVFVVPNSMDWALKKRVPA